MDDTRIRDRAYDLWERDGRPEGRHDDHWHQARRELEGDGGIPAPGPDAGIAVPGNASGDSLREAAERLRDADTDANAPRPSADRGQADDLGTAAMTERQPS